MYREIDLVTHAKDNNINVIMDMRSRGMGKYKIKALNEAARYGHIEVIKILHMKHRAHHSMSAAYIAIEYDQVDVLKYLIDVDVSLNLDSALEIAIKHDSKQVLDYIFKVCNVVSDKNKAIDSCILYGNIDILRKVCISKKAYIGTLEAIAIINHGNIDYLKELLNSTEFDITISQWVTLDDIFYKLNEDYNIECLKIFYQHCVDQLSDRITVDQWNYLNAI